MKKSILSLLVFSVIFIFLTLFLTDSVASTKRQDKELIKKTMKQLGFKVERITKEGGNYIIIVNGYKSKTQAITKKENIKFKRFRVTAKVVNGQVSLDKEDLERKGFIIGTAPLPKGIKIERVKGIKAAPIKPVKAKPKPIKKQLRKQAIAKAPVIKSTSKASLQLEPGKLVEFTLKGSDLGEISTAQVYLGNKQVKDVKVRLDPASPDGRSRRVFLKLPADSKAEPGNYQLRLIAGKQIINLEKAQLSLNVATQRQLQKQLLQDALKAKEVASLLPDLVVHDIVVPTAPVYSEHELIIEMKIKNQGNSPASIPSGFSLYGRRFSWQAPSTLNYSPLYSNLTINPGEIKTYTVTLFAASPKPAGTHTVSFFVDNNNRVTESNEDNNVKTSNSFTIYAPAASPPDLIILNMRLDPPEPTVWDQIKIVVNLENRGDAVTIPQGSNIIHFWKVAGGSGGWGGNKYVGSAELILGQAEFSMLLTGQAKEAGTYTWRAKVDPENIVAESDENNNEKTLTGTIREN